MPVTDPSTDGRAVALAELRRKSAPLLLAERARAQPDAVAFRCKRLGLYEERSWAQFRDLVGDCARGLMALGIAPGDRVAILGDACEEWVICDLAAQSAGAVSYGIYPTASASELAHQMADGGASVLVAENQEYVDKILPLLERLPALRWVVVIDASAMFTYDHPRLRRYDEVLRLGRAAPGDFEAMARAVDPDAPAFIVYTSGTTGAPKGAVVGHGRHLAAVRSLADHYPLLSAAGQRTVIYLPLCHVLGRDVAITLPLLTGLVPHYGESLDDLPQTLFEVAPTVLFTVPRYLQKFASQLLVGIANSTRVKRAVTGLAMAIGKRRARARWQGRVGPWLGLLAGLARQAAFRPILNKIGFDQLRLVACGGAALPAETMALWHVLGVNVVEIYGQTETAGAVIAAQPGPFPRPGDVGRPVSGWQVELAETGEVVVRSPDLFDGYWNNPQATAAVVDSGGWLHTGDVGAWSDGRLRIIDRVRDFIVTSGGKTLSPTTIENALRASPYISEGVVFGHGRKFVSALIEIDRDTVDDWARARGLVTSGYTSLTRHPAVTGLIADEIAKANTELARVEQVKAFRILPKELDPAEEDEPVTPTRKIKRTLMYERFRELVESMYDGAEEELLARGVGDLVASSS